MMRQSDIALDKCCVTQSGYFRLVTTVTLGMCITDGKLLFCLGISEESVDKLFQPYNTTTGLFMAALIIPLQLILVAQI